MDNRRITPVILCGGSGTRLWPRSRASRPKPFLPLVGSHSLFEEALLRCGDTSIFDPPVIVTGARLIEQVEGHLVTGSTAQIIIEPQSRNTAAAIALAASRLPPGTIMLVCPSDHHIADVGAFTEAAQAAARLAADDWLVSFGIRPTRPETGYGYLKKGGPLGEGYQVEQFVEKPDAQGARAFLESGDYVWNGGIFAFEAARFLEELEKHRSELSAAVREAVAAGQADGCRFHPGPEAFSRIRGESVDYAVMENSDRVAMVPVDLGWSDIGNWQAVRDAREPDPNGNVVRGPAELVDCTDVFVDTDGPRVHVIGLSDLIVVVDGDDIVVTNGENAPLVGKLTGAQSQ